MFISQLYRSNPSLNDVGLEILQNWYKQTNAQKQANAKWLADQLRNNENGKHIARGLARRLGVTISDKFPPPTRARKRKR